ncbi:hypothetical protein WMY93_031245 [Mugilogobius chulae]|uniref:Uncharacterized protein n=1 Tax=Mugilogobius chulae TaxID=88201 RepID=A0AAW0MIK4_9GOBI
MREDISINLRSTRVVPQRSGLMTNTGNEPCPDASFQLASALEVCAAAAERVPQNKSTVYGGNEERIRSPQSSCPSHQSPLYRTSAALSKASILSSRLEHFQQHAQ